MLSGTLGSMAQHNDAHDVPTYVKNNPGRAGDWEAAGLRWLHGHAQAYSGAGEGSGLRVARVLERAGDRLVLERVATSSPSAEAAENFGRGLAALHSRRQNLDGQSLRFGSGPAGWDGDGYQGPNDCLLPLPLTPTDSWGAFYADLLESLCTNATGRDSFSTAHRAEIDTLLSRLRSSDFDATASPAPVHGDLWSGNVLWGGAGGGRAIRDGEELAGGDVGGAVLIDPAAHVGHPETDLAALQLFGAPHLERILGAYAEAAGLDRDWRERTPLHQLHLLFLHVAVFGGGYETQAMSAVRASLTL